MKGAEDLSLLSGMPEEQTLERQVRIFKPAKNAMQSGTAGIKRLEPFYKEFLFYHFSLQLKEMYH